MQGTSQRDFATNPPTIRNAHDSRPLDCHPEGAATKDPRLLFVSSIRTEPEKRLTSGLTTIQQLPTQTDGVAQLNATDNGKQEREAETMTPMRWIAVIVFLLALTLRLSRRYVSFELAYRVAPGLHRGISISGPLFWSLLILGTILMASSFFSRAHH